MSEVIDKATKDKRAKQSRDLRKYQEYIVNIELTDQNNNIFYVDDVNEDSNNSIIKLKDYQFKTISGEIDTNPRLIHINRDDYYIDNQVIKEVQNIFKNFQKLNYVIPLDANKKDYNTRYPSDASSVILFMEKTNNFTQNQKVFTSAQLVRIFKENVLNFSSGAYQSDRRITPINRTETLNRIVSDNFKYISNNKKTSDFDEDEIQDALMFANIMYLIKNIYLKKETIIVNVQKELFYVNEITFYDLPFIHMKKKDYESPTRKVDIFLKVNTTPIINIPIIKIHYIIDDLELPTLKISAPRDLKPGDLDKDFANYNTIYIFDNFKYKNENDNFQAFFKSLKNEKKMNKIQELFLNADIVNKYKKRYEDNNKKQYTRENRKEDTEEKKRKELIESKNVNENIIYLLREKFNLLDNKSLIENSFIDDTYIAYDISNIANDVHVKFHSILANKKYYNYDNPKKEGQIKKILAKHINRYNANYVPPNFFYKDERVDKRLKTYVYNIVIIFKIYKKDAKGKKPSLERRFIGDECLSNAGTLDSIFSRLFYRNFGLPDKFLYDKFANISRRALSSTSENKEPVVQATKDSKDNKDSKNTKKGGKKYNIKTKKIKKTKKTKKLQKNIKTTKKYKNYKKILKHAIK
jgi:hypothetical protein